MADDESPLQQWLDVLEGANVYEAAGEEPRDEPIRCDYCSDTIFRNSQVTHYACDRLLNPWIAENLPTLPFWLLRTYCPTCDRRRVEYSCTGYNELILANRLDQEFCYRDTEVIDLSKASDGYAWDPIAVVDAMYDLGGVGMDYETDLRLRSRMYPTMGFGPEDVVDKCRVYDIHPGEILDGDGNLALSSSEQQALAKRIDEQLDAVDEVTGDQKAWRDLVRNR